MINKAKGCFMGQIVGDSLGSQVEFYTKREIRIAYPDGVTDMVNGGEWDILAGQPTDDSEMAIALARSIIDNGNSYNPIKARNNYIDWITSPLAFGIGGTIGPALLKNKFNQNSQANGSMMRVSPLGIWGANHDRALLHKCAANDARLTHDHILVTQCNEIFASLIAEAISTDKSAVDLYNDLINNPEKYTSSGKYEPEVLEWIESAKEKRWKIDGDNRGWVAIALWNALYQMLHTKKFTEAVINTVNEGGDTDTNAAIVGALFGAIYGINAIPTHWQETVLNCKPTRASGTRFPRPERFWPTQVFDLAEKLICK